MKKIILSGLTVIAISSCRQKGISGTKINDASELSQGKSIFENSCGKCHDLPDPKSHTDEQWVDIMKAMAPKVKLSSEQSTIVYNYLTHSN